MTKLFDNIPEELKQKKQWVVWRKGNKTPVNPITLGNAQSNNEETWGTYEQALLAVENKKADGVGFMFNRDFIGVDLDDCFDENKKAKPWAKEILQNLHPSYMEYSVSETGVHIILPRISPLPGPGLNVNFKKRNLHDGIGGVEIYEHGRYFITTGNVLSTKTKSIVGDVGKIMEVYVKYKNIEDRSKEVDRRCSTASNFLFEDITRLVRLDQVISHYGLTTDRTKKMCCPFHSEDTPSLHVYEHDYWCFGCQEYGDATDFVRKMENLPSNYEAAKVISERYNLGLFEKACDLSLQPPKNESPQERSERIKHLLGKALNLSTVKPYNADTVEVVKSGIPSLDKKIGAFEMGLTTVWSGINAAGKSTVLGQAIVESIEQNYKVFAFSGELQAHKFQYWIDLQAAGSPNLTPKTSSLTGRTYYEIKDQAKKKIHRWYNDKLFLYDNKCGMKYDEILEVMDIYHSEMGCKVFLIDNIMRLDLRNLDRDPYEAQSQFINSISDFSQTRSVHVHVVAHPRKVMGSIITKMDVAGSGDLTNRADNVLAVHRVTPAYAEEMRKNLKGNQTLLNSILKASNILEVFKCRDTGEQDIYIPLQFQTESKRLTDMSSPALKDKIYSWDDKSVWLNDATQTKLPF